MTVQILYKNNDNSKNQVLFVEENYNTNTIKNRQEFNKSYIPNGAIYIFNVEKLRLSRQYYMDKTYPYVMPRSRSADIDEILDFEWAEFLINKNK